MRPTSCPTSLNRAPGAQVHSNGFRWRGSFCYVCLIISDDVTSGLFMAKTWRVLGLKNKTQIPNVNVCKAWILRGFRRLMWSSSLVQWPWPRWGRHLTGQASPKAPNRPADSVGKNCSHTAKKENVAKRGQTHSSALLDPTPLHSTCNAMQLQLQFAVWLEPGEI